MRYTGYKRHTQPPPGSKDGEAEAETPIALRLNHHCSKHPPPDPRRPSLPSHLLGEDTTTSATPTFLFKKRINLLRIIAARQSYVVVNALDSLHQISPVMCALLNVADLMTANACLPSFLTSHPPQDDAPFFLFPILCASRVVHSALGSVVY